MKYLSIIFLLICFGLLAHSQASADDVKDFQIEEVGIGESLLDHYTENEILKNKQENQFPKSNNFIVTTFYKDYFKIYQSVSVTYKNDNRYIVHGVEGRLFFPNNIKRCLSKKDKVTNNIKSFLNSDAVQVQDYKKNHSYDRSGNSKITATAFWFKSGGYIQVTCTDWSKKLESKGFTDELKVSSATEEFYNFLLKEAY